MKLLNPAVMAGSVIVAAHPDDEAVGLGAHLADITDLAAILHVTDGAPRAGDDIRNAGCETWQQYAALRRREFENALAVSGASSHFNVSLRCPDQQASFRIAQLATTLAGLFERLRPAVVFTHPYEGGHPDHDATAAAVRAARRLLDDRFTVVEFASYHARGAEMECERFLENHGAAVIDRPLTGEQRERKRAVFRCYCSQQHVLNRFPLQHEPVRAAPEYDFTRPPHEGALLYERCDWGITGAEWCRLAAQAFRELGLTCP